MSNYTTLPVFSDGETSNFDDVDSTQAQQLIMELETLRSLLLGAPKKISNTLQGVFDRIPRNYQEVMDILNERSQRWQTELIELLSILPGLLEKGLVLKGEGWYGEKRKIVEHALSFQSKKSVNLLSNLIIIMQRELQ